MADNRSLAENKEPPSSASQEPDKDIAAGDVDYWGISTMTVAQGADEVYGEKVAIMNRALVDLGMGLFQWGVFALTGLGWFIDNFWMQTITTSVYNLGIATSQLW